MFDYNSTQINDVNPQDLFFIRRQTSSPETLKNNSINSSTRLFFPGRCFSCAINCQILSTSQHEMEYSFFWAFLSDHIIIGQYEHSAGHNYSPITK